MPLNVPPAVNYPSPLNAVPSRWGKDPIEGPKQIPVEIDWGSMGGNSKTINFNLQNNSTLAFSQIVAISVDNSACGADIEFIFPDTLETTQIPAYSPKVVFPVFSNMTQFYLSAPTAQSEDITRFSILNAMPPPIAVPTSQEQEAIGVTGGIDVTTAGPFQIVPASISGTLEGCFVSAWIDANASGGHLEVHFLDGASSYLATGTLGCQGSGTANGILFDNPNMRVRFNNGISISWAKTNLTSGLMMPNLYYRTP